MDIQRLSSGTIPWHVHRRPYLAIVLEGSYEELGDQGRCAIQAGDAVLHLPFERHGNHVSRRGVRIVNVPLSIADALRLQSMRTDDPERVVDAISRGCSVSDALAGDRPSLPALADDEADVLALSLVNGADIEFDAFAASCNLSRRTLRRRFQHLYGTSAAKFRARARARRAWRAILTTPAPLAAIACDLGFADQAHMNRAVLALTGETPSRWRRDMSD
ncbi:MAG: AraC family transcriptional regulator [Sphingomonas sp.]|uniref:AraC family transcriptional regulator n=1 Tax=Sphingomonas sp. TaxID=28214 RepID=UPI001B0DC52A|nr:helix-turn-helix domain-containing protein [Sphingomonas sp.]MBO9621560.1 AraC family transcriptional regulator [Sphingomonas sp.]